MLIVLGVLAVGGGSWMVKGFFVGPLTALDKLKKDLVEKEDKLLKEQRLGFAAEDELNKLALRTFSDDTGLASAALGKMMTQRLADTGLADSRFTRTPVGPNRVRGAHQVGWSVQGDGPLKSVLDLMYLLERDPHVHRIENFSMAPGDRKGEVSVTFRFMTLVLDPAPIVTRKELKLTATTDSEERKLYEGIVKRDLLRPYVKRPPTPPMPPMPPATTTQPAVAEAPKGPGPENFRVVSLSEWNGVPEVHVRDVAGGRTTRHAVGQMMGEGVGGGMVVRVDYRRMEVPGKGGLVSSSRVILKIGADFWAVESGQSLAEKRKMSLEELPAELKSIGGAGSPETKPATPATPGTPVAPGTPGAPASPEKPVNSGNNPPAVPVTPASSGTTGGAGGSIAAGAGG